MEEYDIIKVKISAPVEEKEMVFFNKGEVVRLKRLSSSPDMLVEEIIFDMDLKSGEFNYDSYGNKILLGISCMWFTTTGQIQNYTFNSKDLVKVVEIEKKVRYGKL